MADESQNTPSKNISLYVVAAARSKDLKVHSSQCQSISIRPWYIPRRSSGLNLKIVSLSPGETLYMVCFVQDEDEGRPVKRAAVKWRGGRSWVHQAGSTASMKWNVLAVPP